MATSGTSDLHDISVRLTRIEELLRRASTEIELLWPVVVEHDADGLLISLAEASMAVHRSLIALSECEQPV
jgi:hypothetical protein